MRHLALKACLAWLLIGGPALADCRLSILGDSLTSAYGVPLDAGFPARLSVALAERGSPCEVIDAGVSGDTSAGGAARLDWVLADKPTHLLVELGGNDGLRALPLSELRHNLDDILTRAQAAGVKAMLLGMLPPPNLGQDYFAGFEASYRDLAREHGVPLYPFFLEGVALHPDLLQADGIHPNERGVEEIVRRLLPGIAAFVGG